MDYQISSEAEINLAPMATEHAEDSSLTLDGSDHKNNGCCHMKYQSVGDNGLMVLPCNKTSEVAPTSDVTSMVATLGSGDRPSLMAKKVEDKESLQVNNNPENNGHSIRLPLRRIHKICKLSKKNMDTAESEMTCDMKTMEVLFRCEACQEMPMSSETVHTCELGHQVCGKCYNSGARLCVVCKGHVFGENVPLENLLRKLRQNYGHTFNYSNTSTAKEMDHLSRFYSLKPFECPEDGCTCKSSARSLHEHFEREHKHIPAIDAQLFKPCTVLLPVRSLRNVNGCVVAVVTLTITDDHVSSRLSTDTMSCWVHCGAVTEDEGTAAVWVSCVYEAAHMPPVLYSVRVATAHGHSSFGGQMTPLLDYKNPSSVLADGKCLLFFTNNTKNSGSNSEGNVAIELRFYLG